MYFNLKYEGNDKYNKRVYAWCVIRPKFSVDHVHIMENLIFHNMNMIRETTYRYEAWFIL